jgi:hypothetical protein
MATSVDTIDKKIDLLGDEMRSQTAALKGIQSNTEIQARVALQDQEARDRIYDRLAEGLLKLARVLGVGFLLIFILVSVAVLKTEMRFKGIGAEFQTGGK